MTQGFIELIAGHYMRSEKTTQHSSYECPRLGDVAFIERTYLEMRVRGESVKHSSNSAATVARSAA